MLMYVVNYCFSANLLCELFLGLVSDEIGYEASVMIVLVCGFVHFQAACDDEAEKYERAFVLQLLGSSSTTSSREVLFRFNCHIF